nr:hypothetical protein BaRGS_028852 [Batillaria attramentaria]
MISFTNFYRLEHSVLQDEFRDFVEMDVDLDDTVDVDENVDANVDVNENMDEDEDEVSDLDLDFSDRDYSILSADSSVSESRSPCHVRSKTCLKTRTKKKKTM